MTTRPSRKRKPDAWQCVYKEMLRSVRRYDRAVEKHLKLGARDLCLVWWNKKMGLIEAINILRIHGKLKDPK